MLPFGLGGTHLELQARAKGAIHELNNWLDFWHFRVRQWGGLLLDVSSIRLLCSNFIFNLSFLNFNFIPFILL
jgi:hypothetical protein